MNKELVRIDSLDIGIEDHGILTLRGSLEWERGTCSGWPDYCIDLAFIYRLLDAIGVETLSQARGKSIWMLYEAGKGAICGSFVSDGLIGFAPLHAKDGKEFIIKDWQDWHKRRMPSISPYEYRTGIDPNEHKGVAA